MADTIYNRSRSDQ